MLQVNFIMIYIIHKISVSIKNSVFKRFFKKNYFFKIIIYIIDLFFSKKKFFFSQRRKFQGMKKTEKIKSNIIKDVENLFRLKEEIDNITVKGVKNLFRLKKKQIIMQLKM